MKPVEFGYANLVLKAPEGQEDTVVDMHVMRKKGVIVSCWEVDKADLKTIESTGKVWLIIEGDTHAPCRLTSDPAEIVSIGRSKDG